MTWWDSFDTLSKLQTALAILVAVLGVATLTIKLRADQIKKRTDARRLEERLALDKELKDKTAEALRATAALEEGQAPWPLSDSQKQDFIAHLKDAPKGKVAIEYIRSDETRSREFAVRIRDILKDSGYDVWGYMAGFMQADAPPLIGVQITVKNQQSDIVGGGLQRAFQAIGFPASGGRRAAQDSTYDDDMAVIFIGMKPKQ